MIPTSTRNATLQDLAPMLQARHELTHDLVLPARDLYFADGVLNVIGAEQHLTEDGVTQADGNYRPTSGADGQIADALGVPVRYLRKLRTERPDLYDANVNGWLHGPDGPDPRKFLLRTFTAQDGSEGVLRALLSDRYKIIDDMDVLMSVLGAVRESGLNVDVRSADLSDSKMIVKLNAPGVTALAPILLANYRSPFGHADVEAARRFGNVAQDTREIGRAGDAPVVSAGIRISNSETGGGAFTITPELTVLACTNGIVRTVDAMRNVHLGARLDQSAVRPSDATRRANLELVKSQTQDAVRAFLDPSYINKVVAEVEAKAGVELSGPAQDRIEVVSKALAWTEDEQKGILDHFMRSGSQMTRGGVFNAVTSFSQTVASPDRADELDGSALKVLDLA